ncbi:hypothetical protein ACFC7B_04030 [Enterococcus gallinarum]|uniref:hypothetical protein n=1 Tax=Enterococcus gallinarum TaxID=1353 RepID=UPI0035D72441
MANLNKTVVIQLLDAGIYDIVTDFDIKNEHYGTGCPTCGSWDFEVMIADAAVITDKGDFKVKFFEETIGSSTEAQETMPSQADLMKLLLDKQRLAEISTMKLEEFLDWLETQLRNIAEEKNDVYMELI